MLRQHRRAPGIERRQQRQGRLGEAEDGGVGVGRIDLGQIDQDGLVARVDGFPDVFHRPLDVGRGERFAVVPLDATAQVEGDGEAVPGDFPAFGQGGAVRLEVVVVGQQAVVDIGGDQRGRLCGVDRAGQRDRFGLDDGDQGAAGFWCLRGSLSRGQQRQGCQ